MATADDFDLPEELFCLETSELSRENYLKHLEQAVISDLVGSFQAMSVAAAAAHVRGCARRLLMMRYARVRSHCDDSRGDPPVVQ